MAKRTKEDAAFFNFVLPHSTKEKLRQLAADDHRTMAGWMIHTIEQEFAKKERE